MGDVDDDDDVYYYMRWRLKLEGETENMGVCTKERNVGLHLAPKFFFMWVCIWRLIFFSFFGGRVRDDAALQGM